jgi:predicted metal-dependent enzyme (double-stranded beta helix superfamily)
MNGYFRMTKTEPYSLSDFIGDMTAFVERSPSQAEQAEVAELLVGRLVRNSDWLTPEMSTPRAEGYARKSIYCDPEDRFEIVVLVWQPGQRTPLHDHDGTWGAEGVVKGQLRVYNYVQVKDLPDSCVQLEAIAPAIVNEHGTGQLLPPADCHIVECYGTETAVTVHVYGKQLKKFRLFDAVESADVYRTRLQDVNCVYDDVAWFM